MRDRTSGSQRCGDGAAPRDQRTACIIAHSHFPMDPRVRREAEALLSDGWRVDIVCLRDRGELRADTWGQAKVHRLPVRRHRGISMAHYVIEYAMFFMLAALYVTLLGLRRRYDLVQVHNVPDFLVFAAASLRLFGARVLLDIRDPLPDLYLSKFGGNASHPLVRLACWIEARSTAFADHVLTPGEPSRQRLLGRSVPAQKVTNILNSADPELFAPVPRRGAEKSREGRFNLVYHGGLFRRYGLDIAIQAVHQLRDDIPGLQLRIAGRGEEADDLARLVEQLGLVDRVSLVGWVDSERIRELVADADLGVVPYRRDTFTDLIYPTKAFEYITMGIPTIIAGLAGVAELFPDVPDLFFRPDDVADLARHILLLYQEPQRLSRLAEAAQRAYAPYAWEGQRREYIALVERLVAGAVL